MAHESQPLSLNNASVPHLPRARESLVAVCVMYILPIRYVHTPADIHRVLYHITYALGAHTPACTGCPRRCRRYVKEETRERERVRDRGDQDASLHFLLDMNNEASFLIIDRDKFCSRSF